MPQPAPASIAIRSRAASLATALFLLAAALFLYRSVFIPPFLPVANPGDALHGLASGQRMFQGETIYRDFFEFITPGMPLVHDLLFHLFGLRLWIPNLLAVILGMGLISLNIVIARRLVHPLLALLPAALFLADAHHDLADPTHHVYSLLAALAALAVLIARRTPARVAAAGALCGLSSSFTQTTGFAAALGFAVFLWLDSRHTQASRRSFLRHAAWLAAAFVAAFLLVNAWFIWNAGLARYLWCTIVYPLKYYPKAANYNTLRSLQEFFPDPSAYSSRLAFFFASAKGLLELAFAPLALLFTLVLYFRRHGSRHWEQWARPMLVACVGIFLLLSIVPAPGGFRLRSASLVALILLAWLLRSRRKLARALVALCAVVALLAILHSFIRSRPQPAAILTTPQGRLAFTQDNLPLYDEYRWIQQQAPATGDVYEAIYPGIYFYLDLRNPTPMSQVLSYGYTTRDQVADVIRSLDQHRVRFVLWEPAALNDRPASENPADDTLAPLRAYLYSHYTLVEEFNSGSFMSQVWQRAD